MNLSEMMKEPVAKTGANLSDMYDDPIVDHSWSEDGLVVPGQLTFDPEGSKNPNNTTPELAIEWGTAGPTIDIDEPAGVVERNIPDDALGDADSVIMFARDCMNRGLMGSALTSMIRSRYAKSTLKQAASGLREQFALEGIVGCVVVDARGYGDCRKAIAATENSPYKGFIKYVMGCECGDPQMMPVSASMDFEVSEGLGNPVDDFLDMDISAKTEMVSHCRSTMLPILGAQGDLDSSEMDSTLIDLMNVSGLPGSDVEGLKKDKNNNKYSSNLKTVQAVFRSIQAKKEEDALRPYSEKIDASEHMIDVADNGIEFAASSVSPLDVNLGLSIDQSDVDMPQIKRSSLEGIDKLSSEMADIDIAVEREVQGMVDIDARPAENEIEFTFQSDCDVEMSQFLDPEFEGTDIFALDDERVVEKDMDIDMRQDMRI